MSDFGVKMYKIDFDWGSAPNPIWWAYSTPPLVELTALPWPLAAFNGPYF